MRKKLFGWIFGVALALIAWAFLAPLVGCATISKTCTCQPRPDGGVSLQIRGTKRYWFPITAEGPFPKCGINYDLELVGPGKDWSYRSQSGFYYTIEDIACKTPHWDLGYAWIDSDRKHVTLNLYWVSSPDGLTSADINGRYEVKDKAEPGATAQRL